MTVPPAYGSPGGAAADPLVWVDFTMGIEATTADPTKGTVLYDKASYAIDGAVMHIIYAYEQTVAGAAGDGFYTFQMPGAFQIDVAKVQVAAGGGGAVLGHGRCTVDGGTPKSLVIYARNADEFLVLYDVQFIDHVQTYNLGHVGEISWGFSLTVPIVVA